MKKKMFFKKFLSYMLSVTIFLSLFSGIGFAESQNDGIIELYRSNNVQTVETYEFPTGFTEYLTQELRQCKTLINLSQFNIKPKYIEQVIEVISYDIPEAFHLTGGIYYSSNGNKLASIEVEYAYTKKEYDIMMSTLDKKAEKLLEGLNSKNLTDLQKALILHDRIALNCEYDYERYLENKVPEISFTMYGALVKGVAVCQGYTLAYNYLLNKLGIRSESCPSQELDHVWNIVYINNKPYHVDITFDDPVWDMSGRVYHTYFLNSTQYLKSVNDKHLATDYNTAPTDTTYDDPDVAFWKNSNSGFVLANNDIFYIDNQSRSVKRFGAKTSIYNITTVWWANSFGGRWPNIYSKLASDGKNLLISLDKGIYKINTSSGTVKEIYKPTLSKYENIYGFALIDGYLVYETNPGELGPNYSKDTKRLYQKRVKYTISPLDNPEYIPGDIDSNGGVNLSDVVLLAQRVAGWDVNYNSYALDVNADGSVNLGDVVLLAQSVAGWTGITLH